MDKNSINQTKLWRKQAVLVSIIVMLAGLLFARVLLSAGLILFIGISCFHKDFIQQARHYLSSPFLWMMSLLFLIPLLSGLWSEDLSSWADILRIKLPLLILPFCFAGVRLDEEDCERIAWIFLFMMTVGVAWSFLQYSTDTAAIHASYLKAHTIRTPMQNDHVRFSLLTAVAIMTAVFLLLRRSKTLVRMHKILVGILILLFVFYLHVLAVRIGLICFYIGAFIFFFWSIAHTGRKFLSFVILLAIVVLPVVSYLVFPTFRNRVSYLKWDLSFVKNNVYQAGSNDGNRLRSIKGGWYIQNSEPLTGVGFGDTRKEINDWYDANYPGMVEGDKILPSNEWIIYGAGAGWPGFLLFSVVMIFPFVLKRFNRNPSWWMINIFLALSYLVDIGLEVQYGVFVHAFVLLWWWKWISSQNQIT